MGMIFLMNTYLPLEYKVRARTLSGFAGVQYIMLNGLNLKSKFVYINFQFS